MLRFLSKLCLNSNILQHTFLEQILYFLSFTLRKFDKNHRFEV
jgi:hypothetical protein